MSNKKSIVKNYIYNLLYQMFMLIMPIAVTPYVSRVLGENGSGQYSYIYSIVSYFTLVAGFGFGHYAQRLVASHSGNRYQQSIDFWEIIISRLIPVTVSAIIYIAIALTGIYGEKYIQLVWILSINIFAVAIDVAFFFQGNEEFGKLVIRNIIIKSFGIACIFLFVKNEHDLWKYALIQALSHFLGNGSIWLYLPKLIENVKFTQIKPLRHIRASVILFLPTIATSIYTTLDKTLIGIITQTDSENGNYEYAEKLVKMAMTIITSLGTAMIPRNSQKFASGDMNAVKNNIDISLNFVFFLGIPLICGILAIADNFVPWYLGDGYDKAANLMKIMSPLIVIIGASNVFGLQYLIPSGDDKKFTVAIIVGAVSNFVLNCILIPVMASYGAAIATVIAETCVTCTMLFFIRSNINFWSIITASWKYVCAGLIMYVPCRIMSVNGSSTIGNTFKTVVIGVCIYFLSLVILKDGFLLMCTHKVKAIIKKRRDCDN